MAVDYDQIPDEYMDVKKEIKTALGAINLTETKKSLSTYENAISMMTSNYVRMTFR